MYTIDDNNQNDFEDDEIVESSWNNGTGLIIKIVIIILCVLVLIWLVKELRSNSGKKDTGNVHSSNVLKVRLAAEEFFFIKNNKEKYNVVNLKELKSLGLIDDVVDANNKVCSENGTNALLNSENDSIKMTIKLDCSTNDDEEIFYYNQNNLACQNCDGKTLMTGNNNISKEEEKKEEKEEKTNNDKQQEEGDNSDNNDIRDDDGEYGEYSCVAWTDWQTNRIYDSSLIERTKTLVQGVKYGNEISTVEYGEWSDYKTTPIPLSDNIEVETKVVQNEVWSDTKTSSNIDINDKRIKVISTNTESSNVDCPSGYTLDNNKCLSSINTVGNLTYKEFNSGKYRINNGLCEGVKNIKYGNKYELTYINCNYNRILDQKDNTKDSITVYTYKELISSNVTYYRYRTVSTVKTRDIDIYTNQKYEEKDLPEGFVKVDGTEETFYSYKYAECVK